MAPEVRRFASQLCAPEGPVVGPEDWILNVCSFTRDERWPTRGGDITGTRISQPRQTDIVFTTSSDVTGIPAALAFGPDEALYVTDEGRRSVVRVAPDGTLTDFVTRWEGEPLNGPNDLSFDTDGNLFFSDPWTSSLDNPIGSVYGYAWATGELVKIRSGMAFPNGVVVREDRLYVAETFTRKVWVYDIIGAGQAGNEAEFCELPAVATSGWHGPDGMAFDEEGNLFVAHLGAGCVRIYDRSGELTDTIKVSGERPTNVCFGGADHETLFVTVDDTGELLTINVGVAGAQLNHCPSRTQDHQWATMLPERRVGDV